MSFYLQRGEGETLDHMAGALLAAWYPLPAANYSDDFPNYSLTWREKRKRGKLEKAEFVFII